MAHQEKMDQLVLRDHPVCLDLRVFLDHQGRWVLLYKKFYLNL